jgi:hypothetical protein
MEPICQIWQTATASITRLSKPEINLFESLEKSIRALDLA